MDKLGTAYLPDKDIGILAKLTKNIKCRGFCGYNSKFGGPDRDRTGCLLIANEALYQVSYGPLSSILAHFPSKIKTQGVI